MMTIEKYDGASALAKTARAKRLEKEMRTDDDNIDFNDSVRLTSLLETERSNGCRDFDLMNDTLVLCTENGKAF